MLDDDRLRTLAVHLTSVPVTLGGSRARGTHLPDSAPGAWGPWVDGGAWLTIDGTAVDWIHRDVDRVHASWRSARAGEVRFQTQVGHHSWRTPRPRRTCRAGARPDRHHRGGTRRDARRGGRAGRGRA